MYEIRLNQSVINCFFLKHLQIPICYLTLWSVVKKICFPNFLSHFNQLETQTFMKISETNTSNSIQQKSKINFLEFFHRSKNINQTNVHWYDETPISLTILLGRGTWSNNTFELGSDGIQKWRPRAQTVKMNEEQGCFY